MPDTLSMPRPADGHPHWCSPDQCELATARGLAQHRSTPVVIEGGIGAPTITVWLAGDAYEPPPTAATYVMIRTVEVDGLAEPSDVSTLWTDLPVARDLHAAIGALLGMAGVKPL